MSRVRVPLAEVVAYLDEYLRIGEIPDEPNAVNGLQVENGRQCRIDRRGGGCLAGDDRRRWPPERTETPRCCWCITGSSGTATFRSPADATGGPARFSIRTSRSTPPTSLSIVHPEVGNNAVLAERLGIGMEGWFGDYRGHADRCLGSCAAAAGRARIAAPSSSNQRWGPRRASARLIPGGPEVAGRVGIITGGAGNMIAAARDAGLDTFITGEGPHHTYFDAMEWGINVLFAGHYATETLGVQALASHLAERFGLEWEFHDHPTGL